MNTAKMILQLFLAITIVTTRFEQDFFGFKDQDIGDFPFVFYLIL